MSKDDMRIDVSITTAGSQFEKATYAVPVGGGNANIIIQMNAVTELDGTNVMGYNVIIPGGVTDEGEIREFVKTTFEALVDALTNGGPEVRESWRPGGQGVMTWLYGALALGFLALVVWAFPSVVAQQKAHQAAVRRAREMAALTASFNELARTIREDVTPAMEEFADQVSSTFHALYALRDAHNTGATR